MPIGVSALILSSKCMVFKFLTVIHLKMALAFSTSLLHAEISILTKSVKLCWFSFATLIIEQKELNISYKKKFSCINNYTYINCNIVYMIKNIGVTVNVRFWNHWRTWRRQLTWIGWCLFIDYLRLNRLVILFLANKERKQNKIKAKVKSSIHKIFKLILIKIF